MVNVEGKNLLLVEDEELVAFSKTDLLTKLGYKVLLAESGERAVELASSEPAIDLILMDIDLGYGIDGAETARRILRERNIPIVFHSVHADSVNLEKVRGIPHFGYVMKSSCDLMLETSIERALVLFQTGEKYRSLYLTCPDPIIISGIDGRVFDLNDCFSKTFGYTRQELVDKNIEGVFLPDEPGLRTSRVSQLLRQGSVENIELPIRAKNGNILTCLVSARIVNAEDDPQILTILRDITKRKKTEEALRLSEEKYRVIFNNEIYAICIFDLETLRLLDVNDAYLRLYGYSREELLGGMTIHDITVEHEESETATAKAKTEGTTYIPLRYHRKKDGTLFPVEIVGGPYEWNGRRVMFALAHDITDRVRSGHEISTLLDEKNLLLDEVHHRVKNNMNTVISLLSLQESTMKDSAAASALKEAQNRIRSMGLLYEKLYQTGSIQEICLRDYLPALVEEIIRILATKTKIKTRITVDDSKLDIKILSGLGIIVNELITNAVKYAFLGREEGLIYVTASRSGDRLLVSIGDDGSGIPASVNLENSAGLGFKIIQALINQYAGTIRIERSGGTRFDLLLKIQES